MWATTFASWRLELLVTVPFHKKTLHSYSFSYMLYECLDLLSHSSCDPVIPPNWQSHQCWDVLVDSRGCKWLLLRLYLFGVTLQPPLPAPLLKLTACVACCALNCRPKHVFLRARWTELNSHLSESLSLTHSLYVCVYVLWPIVTYCKDRSAHSLSDECLITLKPIESAFLKCRLFCTEALEST